MEHSLHLGAGHFVRGVAPTSSSKILKKVQHGVRNAHDSGTCDLDQLDTELTDAEDGDKVADDQNYAVEFDVADSIRKALALVNQVRI